MTNIFHRSDDHFFHDKIADERGFSSIEEHNAALVELHNEMVKPEDTVFFHGDLHLSLKDLDRTLDLIDTMHGTKYLLLGNHDAGSPTSAKGHRFLKSYYRTFEGVNTVMTAKIASRRVILSHYPFRGDHTEDDRFQEFRPVDTGDRVVLHGHTHFDGDPFDGNQIHVGLDAWDLRPVPRGVISDYVSTLRK